VEVEKLQNKINTEAGFSFEKMFAKVSLVGNETRIFFFFVFWLCWGSVASMWALEYSFLDSLYICISAMSTGGMKTVPVDADDIYYAILALYAAVGVPVLAVTCGVVAQQLDTRVKDSDMEAQISCRVTAEEVEMMSSIGIEDGDGYIDSGEYVILILVRIGVLKPDLLVAIIDRFETLDVDKKNALTYDNIKNIHHNLGTL
jgi:hypothetical protein